MEARGTESLSEYSGGVGREDRPASSPPRIAIPLWPPPTADPPESSGKQSSSRHAFVLLVALVSLVLAVVAVVAYEIAGTHNSAGVPNHGTARSPLSPGATYAGETVPGWWEIVEPEFKEVTVDMGNVDNDASNLDQGTPSPDCERMDTDVARLDTEPSAAKRSISLPFQAAIEGLGTAGGFCETISDSWNNLGELEAEMSVASTDFEQMYSAMSGYLPTGAVLPSIPQVGGN